MYIAFHLQLSLLKIAKNPQGGVIYHKRVKKQAAFLSPEKNEKSFHDLL